MSIKYIIPGSSRKKPTAVNWNNDTKISSTQTTIQRKQFQCVFGVVERFQVLSFSLKISPA